MRIALDTNVVLRTASGGDLEHARPPLVTLNPGDLKRFPSIDCIIP